MNSGVHSSWEPLTAWGTIQQGSTLSRSKGDEGQKFRVIHIRNLDTLEVSGVLDEDIYSQKKVLKYLVEDGDVLVGLRANPVKASVVPESLSGALIGSNLARIRPHRDVNPSYLAGLLRSAFINRRLSSLIGGTVNPSLSVATLRSVELPWLVASEQTLLVESFRALDTYAALSAELVERRHERLEVQLAHLFPISHDR